MNRNRTAPRVLLIAATAQRVGVSGVVSLLARGLASRDFDVRVLCLVPGPLIAELEARGIEAGVFPTAGPFDPAAVLRLRADLARAPADLVHTHGQRAMFIGNLAARLERTPAIVTSFHEMASVKSTTSPWFRVYAAGEAVLARFATDVCVATSEAVARDARDVRHVPPARLVTIHNAIDRERFHPLADPAAAARLRAALGFDREDRVIGCLGTLAPIKGHRHLIEALPKVRRRVPRARLAIAGEGPLRDELGALAARLGVARDVVMPGVVDDPNTFYHALDAMALPSLSESCPMVVLEAIACRVPVVASRVGGVPDLVKDEETGLLVPAADPEALANAIVRVLEDPALAARLTAAAESFADAEYSASRQVDRHAELYRQLLAGSMH